MHPRAVLGSAHRSTYRRRRWGSDLDSEMKGKPSFVPPFKEPPPSLKLSFICPIWEVLPVLKFSFTFLLRVKNSNVAFLNQISKGHRHVCVGSVGQYGLL